MSETPRMLRLPAVMELTGLGRDSIYRLAREGSFPMQRKLSAAASAWRSDEVLAWIESRPRVDECSAVAAIRSAAVSIKTAGPIESSAAQALHRATHTAEKRRRRRARQ